MSPINANAAPPSAGPSADASRYPHLFSPVQLGRLTIPNRFVVPALTTNFAELDGTVGDRLIEYLNARTSGGYGLVITENIGVHPSGRVMPKMVMAHDDSFIPGLRRLVRTVKHSGGLLFGQLSHAGRQTKSRVTRMPLVAPSAIACPLNREEPQALTVEGVHGMEQAFVDAAVRLAQVGFDGLEIHSAHGYLVGAFLSRYSNKRTDHYGGSLENRMRFLRTIVRGIKRALGNEFPISVRISAREFVEDGLDLAEAVIVAKRLAAEGVHALSVSVGVYESFNRLSMITGEPEGQWLDLAGAIRREVAPLPVIGVGRIKRPKVAEEALARGCIDLAAFGRASIADPDLPLKVLEGRQDQINWCLGCNVCLGRSARPETICPVNPAVGKEFMFRFDRSIEPRHIQIMGASLSALTAAWMAAERGNTVLIDPVGEPLGGMQAWRSGVPGQEEYAEGITALTHRAVRAGVTFPPYRASPEDLVWRVRRYQPYDPSWRGRHHVVCSAYQVLSGEQSFAQGSQVAVVGVDLAAAEAAIVLAKAGCRVRLFSAMRDIAVDAHPGYREASRARLLQYEAEVRLCDDGPQSHDLRWAEALVVGHPKEASYEDEPNWSAPQGAASDESTVTDAIIPDTYEPGLMTRGIYDAVDLALSFDRH